ncbi:MAG: septal ring lytic transglycosylase RlpA family protein [Bacteroidota bacterium]
MRYYLSFCLLLLSSFLVEAQAPQYGLASYYGDYLHGRPTASGEKYDLKKFTCAHRQLDFGTMVKVTRTDNNRYVIVRVNDRGPFVKGRIVDLSRAAANHIGLDKDGITKVKLEILPDEADLSQNKSTNIPEGQIPTSFDAPMEATVADLEAAQEAPAVENESSNSIIARVMRSATKTPRNKTTNNNFPTTEKTVNVSPSTDNIPASTEIPSSFDIPSSYEDLTEKGAISEPVKREETPNNPQSGNIRLKELMIAPTAKSPTTTAKSPAVSTTSPPAAVSIESYDFYEKPSANGQYSIQLAAFKDRKNADKRLAELKDRQLEGLYVREIGGAYKVMYGSFGFRSEASSRLSEMKAKHGMKGFVVKLK